MFKRKPPASFCLSAAKPKTPSNHPKGSEGV